MSAKADQAQSLSPQSADSLMATLLALSIHAFLLDAITQGRPTTSDAVDQMPLAQIAHTVAVRPAHELLAGLPYLDGEDQLRVNILKVLIYDDASALPLARLSEMTRITVTQLAASLSEDNPVCADIPSIDPGHGAHNRVD